MPANTRDRVVALLVAGLVVEHAQVPDAELALVVAGSQQELARCVPAQHVHVAVMGPEGYLGLHLCRS